MDTHTTTQTKTKSRRPGLDDIIGVTATAFGLTAEDMKGGSRRRIPSMARGLAALIARGAGYTYRSIGEALNRDHSTMVTASFRAQWDVRYLPETADRYDAIRSQLQSLC